jgi:hypothetical protein
VSRDTFLTQSLCITSLLKSIVKRDTLAESRRSLQTIGTPESISYLALVISDRLQ